MPQSSRLLYYDLGMAADDDGVVEAFTVIRTTGAAEDDLRVLASKGFITVLNEDLVSFISDWRENNFIRSDRYKPSIYAEMLVKITDGNQMTTNGIPKVDQRETQVRLGKDSIGKVSIGESIAPPSAATPALEKKLTRKKYGQYGWIKLSDEEYSRLLNDLGETELKRCIAYIDEAAQSNGNKNKWRDWNLVIRRCSRDRWGRNKNTHEVKTASDYDDGEDFFS
jgi:hypothetical protein